MLFIIQFHFKMHGPYNIKILFISNENICVKVYLRCCRRQKYCILFASLPFLFLLLVFFFFYKHRTPNFISVLSSYRQLSPSFSSLFTFIFTNLRSKNKVKNFSFCAQHWLCSYYVHLEFVPLVTN
jgi:hypothetical protein